MTEPAPPHVRPHPWPTHKIKKKKRREKEPDPQIQVRGERFTFPNSNSIIAPSVLLLITTTAKVLPSINPTDFNPITGPTSTTLHSSHRTRDPSIRGFPFSSSELNPMEKRGNWSEKGENWSIGSEGFGSVERELDDYNLVSSLLRKKEERDAMGAAFRWSRRQVRHDTPSWFGPSSDEELFLSYYFVFVGTKIPYFNVGKWQHNQHSLIPTLASLTFSLIINNYTSAEYIEFMFLKYSSQFAGKKYCHVIIII